jgi:hypothetical protein
MAMPRKAARSLWKFYKDVWYDCFLLGIILTFLVLGALAVVAYGIMALFSALGL